MKNTKFLIGLNIIFAILLIVSFFTYGFRGINQKLLNTANGKEIINKAFAIIKTKLPPNKSIVLKDFSKENFYLVTSSIVDKNSTSTKNGQDFPFYLNSDGSKLFTKYIPLEPEKPTAFKKTDTPDVMLFTMAFCPYGNQAENNIEPAIKLLKKYINFEPHYVIYGGGPYKSHWRNYCLTSQANYCSMHGIGELHEDMRELCILNHNPDKYWQFVLSINKNCQPSNADKCWLKYAKENGLDASQIENCQNKEAVSFLKKEVALNKQYKVEGSPTLIINGTVYNGQRSAEAYKEAICSAFKNQPKECQTKLSTKVIGPNGSCK